jgi:hypothetical protein
VGNGFESVCAKALSLDPKKRYPNAKELLGALDAALAADERGQPAAKRRVLLPESPAEPEEIDASRLSTETTATSPPAVAAIVPAQATPARGARTWPSRMLVGIALVALIGSGVAVTLSARTPAAGVPTTIESPASVAPAPSVIEAASDKPAVPEPVRSAVVRPVASTRNVPATASASPSTSGTPTPIDQIAALGTREQKMQLKKDLEEKVNAGRATRHEVGLLIFVCGQLGDATCTAKAMQHQAAHGGTPGIPTSIPPVPPWYDPDD